MALIRPGDTFGSDQLKKLVLEISLAWPDLAFDHAGDRMALYSPDVAQFIAFDYAEGPHVIEESNA